MFKNAAVTVGAVIYALVKVVMFVWDHFGKQIVDVIKAAWQLVVNVIGGVLDVLAGVFGLIADLLTGK